MSNTLLLVTQTVNPTIVVNAFIKKISILYRDERLYAVLEFESTLHAADGSNFIFSLLAARLNVLFELFKVNELEQFNMMPCQIVIRDEKVVDVMPYLESGSLQGRVDEAGSKAAKFITHTENKKTVHYVNAIIKKATFGYVRYRNICVELEFYIPHIEHGGVYDGVMYVRPKQEGEKLLRKQFGVYELDNMVGQACRVKVRDTNPVYGIDIAPALKDIWLREE